MPHNYCYHSKKSKLIYFEFSSHCLVWLASRLEPAREPPPSRAEPDFLARKNSEPSRARLVHLPSRTEPSRARLGSFPALAGTADSAQSVGAPRLEPRPLDPASPRGLADFAALGKP